MSSKGGDKLLDDAGVYTSAKVPEGWIWNDDVSPAMDAERILTRCTPATSNVANPGDLIRFEIPNTGMADFRQALLMFYFTATQTGGTYVRPSLGLYTVIKKIRIIVGTKEICDVNDYNLLASFIQQTFSSSDSSQTGQALEGVGSTTTIRNGYSAGQRFGIAIRLECLTKKAWPVCLMKEKMYWEITLDQALNVLESDGTSNVNFQLSLIELQYDQYVVPEWYKSALMRSKLCLKYTNCNIVKQTMTAASADYQISEKSACMKAIVAIMRLQSAVGAAPTVNDKFITWNFNNALTYQVRHNGHYHPPQPVDCTTWDIQGYWHYLRMFGLWDFFNASENKTGNVSINSTTFNTTRFIMPIELESFPHSHLISGKDAVQSTENIVFTIVLSATPAATEVDFLCFSEYIVTIDNGILTVTR